MIVYIRTSYHIHSLGLSSMKLISSTLVLKFFCLVGWMLCFLLPNMDLLRLVKLTMTTVTLSSDFYMRLYLRIFSVALAVNS